MTNKTTVISISEQDEYGYYTYTPEWEDGEIQVDPLDKVLPDIWEAVALYLEAITEEKSVAFVY